MATPYYIPESNVPLPPKGADVISTACDYCIVACGFNVFRWPVTAQAFQSRAPSRCVLSPASRRRNPSAPVGVPVTNNAIVRCCALAG